MAENRTFFLVHNQARQGVAQYAMQAPEGWTVTFRPPNRSSDQNAKMHAMFSDIAKQCTFMGERLDSEDWKRLLVDAFARVMASQGTPIRHGCRIVPALDGQGFVQLGIQTRRFLKKEASEFIEYLYAYGAENNVRWTDNQPMEIAE